MVSHSTPPYTIGFFTTGSDLEYSSVLAHTVSKVAKEQNINVITFLGGSLNPNISFSQYKYQYQCNVTFNYAHSPHIDGIILASGVLASFLDPNEFNDFYTQFTSVPIVSLGMNIEDLPSVYTNNTEVYAELVSHIINVHHRKRIAFIAGPTNNGSSYERYLGYIKGLYLHNIPSLPELVYVGDYTPASAKNAIINFIDEKHLDIDAIVCGNDAMALTVITELKNRGFSIPDDILVTGCDNLPSAACSVPSLTSIAQSIDESVSKAFNLLIQKMQGNTVTNVVVPSQIYFRESCPYLALDHIDSKVITSYSLTEKTLTNNLLQLFSRTLNTTLLEQIPKFISTCYHIAQHNTITEMTPKELANLLLTPLKMHTLPLDTILQFKDYLFQLQTELIHLTSEFETIQYLTTVINKIQQFIVNCILDCYDTETLHMNQNFSSIRQFLLTITHNISDRTKQLQSVIPTLMNFGIHSCLIYLYPKGITHNLSDTWQMPEEINLYMGFIDGVVIPSDTLPRQVKGDDIVTYALDGRDSHYVAYMHPIFFGNEQLGICVFELEYENYTLIESITVELACALKLSATFNDQRQTEDKLQMLSQTDELTRLLNRRGFFNLSHDKYAFSNAAHHSGILFYADMDGLKTINDTYGHHEGDYAIISMANILKETFSNGSIIGRIGGDEFVILSTNKEEAYIDEAIQNINKLCMKHNRISNKPYNLSISIGGIFYLPEQNESLENLLSKADKLLYEKKRKKKAKFKNQKQKG